MRLTTPQGEVDVFNTHLHSNYSHEYLTQPPLVIRRSVNPDGSWTGAPYPFDDDASTRIAQILELSQLMTIVSGGSSRPTILGGDMNCEPDTLEMDLLRARLPWVSDAWASTRRRSSGGGSSGSTGAVTAASTQQSEADALTASRPLTPAAAEGGGGNNEGIAAAAPAGGGDGGSPRSQQQEQESDVSKGLLSKEEFPSEINPHGYTCKAPGNTFKPKRQVPERIDYVWSDLPCSSAELVLQVTPGGFSYSDHFGLLTELEWRQPSTSGAAAGNTLELGSPAVAPAIRPSSPGPMRLGAAGGGAGAASRLGGGAAKVATAAAGAKAKGEGSKMSLQRQQATAVGAAAILEQGMSTFRGTSGVMMAVNMALLVLIIYTAIGLPIVWPGLALKGWWFSATLVLTEVLAGVGVCGVLMALLGDKSQVRALQNAYRQLYVWMQQRGLSPPHMTRPGPPAQ